MKNLKVYCLGKGKIEIDEEPIIEPKEDEVLIRCLANGICMAEISLFAGLEKVGEKSQSLMGHEGFGIIEKKGKNVTNVKEGDYVVSWKWNTYEIQKAEDLKKFNIKKVDDPSLYVVEPPSCVVNAYQFYEIIPGDKVLLLGVGFMGLLNLQLVSHAPVGEIFVADINPNNLKLAKEYGATKVFNLANEEDKKELEKYKNYFDLVIESAGAEATIQVAGEYARPAGTIGIFAWHHIERNVNLGKWHVKGLKVLNPSPVMGENRKIDNFGRAITLVENKVFNLEKLVTHRFRVEDTEKALKTCIERPSNYIKAVLLF